jgi:UDP-glucose 4-epimerase
VGAEVVLGPAENPDLLERALADVDHVVHALGCPYPAESAVDPAKDLMYTIPTLVELLEQLRSRPEIQLTFISSGGTVYGNTGLDMVPEQAPTEPITPYGITKLTAERFIDMYARLYGVRATVLRVSNAYGPRQRAERGQGVIAAFLKAALLGEAVHIFGDGSLIRDYVHVDDVAHAVVALSALNERPPIINVGTGIGHSVRDVLSAVEDATGVSLETIWLPGRNFDVEHVVLNVSRLRRLIPWTPRSLEQGIAEIGSEWSSYPSVLIA